MKFWNQADPHRREDLADKDLDQFIFEFQTTGAKLAGALNGMARDLGSSNAAFTVACLKRALDPLHKSQVGLEAVRRSDCCRKRWWRMRDGIGSRFGRRSCS